MEQRWIIWYIMPIWSRAPAGMAAMYLWKSSIGMRMICLCLASLSFNKLTRCVNLRFENRYLKRCNLPDRVVVSDFVTTTFLIRYLHSYHKKPRLLPWFFLILYRQIQTRKIISVLLSNACCTWFHQQRLFVHKHCIGGSTNSAKALKNNRVGTIVEYFISCFFLIICEQLYWLNPHRLE